MRQKALGELQRDIHQTAKEKGWWDSNRNVGELIALMHSELSEALEEWRDWGVTGFRERNYASVTKAGEGKPEGLGIELADCVIRIMDFCEREHIDLEEMITVKMQFNRGRPHRHGGKLA